MPLWRSYGARMALVWRSYGARMALVCERCGTRVEFSQKRKATQKNLQMASRLQVYVYAYMHLSTQCAAYASAFLATSARSAKVASSS